MHWFFYILIFLIATFVGYKIIDRVPSLLHTPLMSGMNAFSGVTLLACLSATAAAVLVKGSVLSVLMGMLAIILATINMLAGFGVTGRMLKMFHKQDEEEQ